MITLWNSIAGIVFVAIAMALTFLMFYLWKFPYDKSLQKSAAPERLVKLHRWLGYVYVVIYIGLMCQMVPRLWSYQIELPTRTVVHLTLGMSIGIILIIKIAIVRYYKHMEAKLVPFLGVGLLICSMLLSFLALPFSLREVYLNTQALTGDEAVIQDRIQRIRDQLPKAGIEDTELIDELATQESLDRGRTVLMNKCTQCHDLRTVLAKPRTPDSWWQTVQRMANRSTILNPVSEDDQLQVTAYLIAISPTLQNTMVTQRRQASKVSTMQQSSLDEAKSMMGKDEPADATEIALEDAKVTFENRCSQCHAPTQIENAPPANRDAANQLVQRMIGHGLVVESDELKQIVEYISVTYIDDAQSSSQAEESQSASTTDGASLYSEKGCAACHGATGREPVVPNYPKLAGQSSTYLAQQIRDIKSGARDSGQAAIMRGAVLNVSDDEIDAISEFLAAQTE